MDCGVLRRERQANVRLSQQGSGASFGLRTNCEVFHSTDAPDVFADTASRRHLVATYDGMTMRMFVDGVAHQTVEPLQGDLSNWNPTYRLVIGNDSSLRHSYQGKIFLVAIYDRALSPDEINQNFVAGIQSRGGALLME